MRSIVLSAALAIAVATTACATAQPSTVVIEPLGIDQLQELSAQGLSDDALIAQIERQGVSFVLTQRDLEAQRNAGVSEGVLRYLQGRAVGEQALTGLIVTGQYRLPTYVGLTYLGYPYLGDYDGMHYYGGSAGHRLGHAGHRGGHHGRHHGGHH